MTMIARLFASTLLFIPCLALAAGTISLETRVEKREISRLNGTEQTSYLPTVEALPGDVLRYTLTYRNTGNQTAQGVVLDNPIPAGTSYLKESATQQGTEALLFSIDNGATFAPPGELLTEQPGPDGTPELRAAPPESYTHIRWKILPLAAGAAGEVSFHVTIN